MANTILFDDVEFRQVPEWPGYAVSRCGLVISSHGRGASQGASEVWRPLAAQNNGSGYLKVGLYFEGNGKGKGVLVHRFVLLAWVGSPLAGQQARHLDGNQRNNRLENLAWGTGKENQADRFVHGTSGNGSCNAAAKLTENEVLTVLDLIAESVPGQTIARWFGVSDATISLIKHGKNWSHLTGLGRQRKHSCDNY